MHVSFYETVMSSHWSVPTLKPYSWRHFINSFYMDMNMLQVQRPCIIASFRTGMTVFTCLCALRAIGENFFDKAAVAMAADRERVGERNKSKIVRSTRSSPWRDCRVAFRSIYQLIFGLFWNCKKGLTWSSCKYYPQACNIKKFRSF